MKAMTKATATTAAVLLLAFGSRRRTCSGLAVARSGGNNKNPAARGVAASPDGEDAGTSRSAARNKVLFEWLSVNDRFRSNAVEMLIDDTAAAAALTLAATRPVSSGEVLFRLGRSAVWTGSDAYDDRDLGPKLRDIAVRVGPGFDAVALAGALGAEKVRRYRSREGLGTAPESSGFTVPSKWGAYARWLWSKEEEDRSSIAAQWLWLKGEEDPSSIASIDETLYGLVSEGVRLLVPLLELAARRYWTADAADVPDEAAFPSDERWTREALVEDGSPRSWSRSELESVALDSLGVVLSQANFPPRFLLDAEVGSLIPDPFLSIDEPETWPRSGGASLKALVPLVGGDGLLFSTTEQDEKPNAVIGSPPRKRRHGDPDDCLWCVATRKIKVGERVVFRCPWNLEETES